MAFDYVSKKGMNRAVGTILGLIDSIEKKLVAASTSRAGLVQLNDTLESTSTTEALTAAQGKALNDKISTLPGDGSITTDKLADGAVTMDKVGTDVFASLGALIPRYCVCNTAADTADKTVEIEKFTLALGNLLAVQFTNGNDVASGVTLSINGSEKIPVVGTYGGEGLLLNLLDIVWLVYMPFGFMLVSIPDASTSQAGKVKLNDTLTSTSTTEALTAAQGKVLKDMIDGMDSDIPNGSITTAKLADGAVTADKLADGAVPAASTTQAGLVQLNNTLTSTSTTQALTAAQGKALNDKAVKYGTCSTTAATAAKTVSISGFSLVSGALVVVKFTSGNTASSPTLNISSTGAKRIYRDGSYSDSLDLAAGEAVLLVYDGSYYRVVDIPDASTTRAGKVQLNNTLTSTSTTQALTAAQGKALNDKIPDIEVESGNCTLRTNTGSKTSSCQYYKIGKLVTVYGKLPNYTGSSTSVSGLPFTPANAASTITGTGTMYEYYILYAATTGNLFLRDAAAHTGYVEDGWKGQDFTLTYITNS